MKSIVILCLKSGADPPLRPPRIAWLEGIVASDQQQRNGWIYLWGCIIPNPPKVTGALFMTIEKVGGPVKNLGIPIKLLYIIEFEILKSGQKHIFGTAKYVKFSLSYISLWILYTCIYLLAWIQRFGVRVPLRSRHFVSQKLLTLSQEHLFMCRKWMLLPLHS